MILVHFIFRGNLLTVTIVAIVTEPTICRTRYGVPQVAVIDVAVIAISAKEIHQWQSADEAAIGAFWGRFGCGSCGGCGCCSSWI